MEHTITTRPPRRRPQSTRPAHHCDIANELETAGWTRIITHNPTTTTWVHPNGSELGVTISPVIQPNEAATIRATIQIQGTDR